MFVEGNVKERDYVIAQFLHLRPRPIFTIMGILLLAILIWAIFKGLSSLYLFGAMAYLVLWFFFYIPWRAKETYRQYKALSEPVSMEIRSDGLYFKRQNGEGLVPWSHIVKWRNNKELLLLYPANNVFYMIPDHFFANKEDYMAFIDTVKSHLGKVR